MSKITDAARRHPAAHQTQDRFRTLQEKVEVAMRWHDLCHFAVSLWIEQGFSIKGIMTFAGHTLATDDIRVEALPAPHASPTRLPKGQVAVYVFSHGDVVLKVGKAGPKSQARYTGQNYNPGSAQSTLAALMIADAERMGLGEVDMAEIGNWIRANVDRVNILLPARLGIPVLTMLESFLQCRLRPRYEGFKSQRG